jgi:hypothetical protein
MAGDGILPGYGRRARKLVRPARLLGVLLFAFVVLSSLLYTTLANRTAGESCQSTTEAFVAQLTDSVPVNVSSCSSTTYANVPAGRLEVYADKRCEPQDFSRAFFFWLDYTQPASLVFGNGEIRSVKLAIIKGKPVAVVRDSFGHAPIAVGLYKIPVGLGIYSTNIKVAFIIYGWPSPTAVIRADKLKGPYLNGVD